jgi:hypothetical protein
MAKAVDLPWISGPSTAKIAHFRRNANKNLIRQNKWTKSSDLLEWRGNCLFR